MADESVKKVSMETAPAGDMGHKYPASGVSVAMRHWEDEPTGPPARVHARDEPVTGLG